MQDPEILSEAGDTTTRVDTLEGDVADASQVFAL